MTEKEYLRIIVDKDGKLKAFGSKGDFSRVPSVASMLEHGWEIVSQTPILAKPYGIEYILVHKFQI